MTCLYSSYGTGHCQLAGGPDYEEEVADTEEYACDPDGTCWCEDDPYPGDSCPSFATSLGGFTCDRCGENKEDCECKDRNWEDEDEE